MESPQQYQTPSAQDSPPHPFGLTAAAYVETMAGRIRFAGLGGKPAALEAYRAVFRRGETTLDGVPLKQYPIVRMLREESAEGEVVKFLTALPRRNAPTTAAMEGEDLTVESVLIPMIGSKRELSYTLCVSSQVGCAMGCTFCETAQMGLLRSLLAEEIVAQWWNAAHVVGIRPKNIVYMGMGEPMDNFDNVIRAIDVLRDDNGAGVAVSQVTISTVGRVDGIRRLAEKIHEPGWKRLGLALSLNAPNDTDRSAIMPINRKWGLKDLQEALAHWPRFAGNKLCIEYVLIPGVNDSEKHAEEIAAFMRPFGLCVSGRVGGQPLLAMLNLIPYNPRRDSPWPAPEESRIEQFMAWLVERGVFVKRRRTKGRRMMGACGQLGAAHIRARKLVQPTISA